jgi:hypothetical protein
MMKAPSAWHNARFPDNTEMGWHLPATERPAVVIFTSVFD